MTKIEVKAIAPKTLKEARGGDDNWALKHLPEQARIPYTNIVVPLARKKAGSLDPWESLTVEHIQDIVDHVFGKQYKVTRDGVWYGLVSLSHFNFKSADQLDRRLDLGCTAGAIGSRKVR